MYNVIKKIVNILPIIVIYFGLLLIYNSGTFPKKSIPFKNSQKSIKYLLYNYIIFHFIDNIIYINVNFFPLNKF